LVSGEWTQEQFDTWAAGFWANHQTSQKANFLPGLDTSPEAYADAQQRRDTYLQATNLAGDDWQRKLQAWNDFGAQPFSYNSTLANLAAPFLLDPTNLLPLNVFGWVNRGKYALEAGRGVSDAVRPFKTAWTFLSAGDREIDAANEAWRSIRAMGADVSNEQIVKELGRGVRFVALSRMRFCGRLPTSILRCVVGSMR
jgi:hypothetical protein